MKPIKPYSNDSFEFFEDAVSRKHKGVVKTTLTSNKDLIRDAFRNYDKHFDEDLLVTLNSLRLAEDLKTALLDLYSYDAKTFRDLKSSLTTTSEGRAITLCPLCIIDSIGTFDHILPKEEFAEFSSHPKNLIPSCSICNSRKNNNWRKDGKLLFLNLFKDKIPDKQYLFVKVININSIPFPQFYIDNRFGIDPIFFERIESHYTRLKLCQRFGEASGLVIGEITSSVQWLFNPDGSRNEDAMKTQLTSYAKELRKVQGYNYWKALLYEVVATDTDLFSAVCVKS